jgi:hypothetical protein
MIVNFGCGSNVAPSTPGYVNVDGSPTVLLAKLPVPASFFRRRAEFIQIIRKHRVRYGTAHSLNFRKASLDGFYASHVLDHLSQAECEKFLLRIRYWLKPSGVMRVVLPDLRRFAASYIADMTDASQFLESLLIARNGQRWWETILGNSLHRWMYDPASFTKLLAKAGFSDIRECALHQGRLQDLVVLDIPSRQGESFYVEASR